MKRCEWIGVQKRCKIFLVHTLTETNHFCLPHFIYYCYCKLRKLCKKNQLTLNKIGNYRCINCISYQKATIFQGQCKPKEKQKKIMFSYHYINFFWKCNTQNTECDSCKHCRDQYCFGLPAASTEQNCFFSFHCFDFARVYYKLIFH